MKINKRFFLYSKLALVLLALFLAYFFAKDNNEIKASEAEDGEAASQKIIYLTFDDGPSVLTNNVLDILKKNDIKATFFLIGNQIEDQKQVVKRIYEEGHGIGLHTYTHSFKKVYSSNQNLVKEMLQCQDEIYQVVGIRPNIIRFPGGSYKRLSKKFLETLHDSHFKIYDWNICLSDGINANTPVSKLYREATKTQEIEDPIILLMHCDYMHQNTCKVLPSIIKYYKEKNYEFKVITEDTKEQIFPLK